MARRMLAVGLLFCAVRGAAETVTVTQPTRLELQSQGRAAGAIGLKGGERVEVVEADATHLVVRYRNLTGRLPAAATDYRPAVAAPAAVPPPVSAPASPAPADRKAELAPPPQSPAPAAQVPQGPIERALAGKLVALEQGTVRARGPEHLAGVRFFALYFSASWCGPCRAFTPELVDAYGKIRALYPEFEVVHVNRDRSPAAMAAYLREDKMPWPALAWEATRDAREITRYAGSGIPCLVLVDRDGKVLSDSYRWGRYVGPDAVLEDTWKLLRDYRRKNPRPKG
jgi:nucleoredoxin